MSDDQGRYSTSGLPEAEAEPGSNGEVLRNLRGITSRHEMDVAETFELLCVTEGAIDGFGPAHRFTAADICELHRQWLGSIYPWAGQYRQVMLSKGGFPFAAPTHIPALMTDFDNTVLARCTPCQPAPNAGVTQALAMVHVELVLIHPFREGNGRLARLLAILMALQAGLPLLDFGLFDTKREQYFAAVQAGLERNYESMRKLFEEIIAGSVSQS